MKIKYYHFSFYTKLSLCNNTNFLNISYHRVVKRLIVFFSQLKFINYPTVRRRLGPQQKVRQSDQMERGRDLELFTLIFIKRRPTGPPQIVDPKPLQQMAWLTSWRKLVDTLYIKYCVFSKILKYIPDSGLSRFFLGVYTSCLDH